MYLCIYYIIPITPFNPNKYFVLYYGQVNGFSNKYWGWGGEDDDMSSRLRGSNLPITRYPESIAR